MYTAQSKADKCLVNLPRVAKNLKDYEIAKKSENKTDESQRNS